MRKLKHVEKDAEKMANGLGYFIIMAAVFLVLFFGAVYILNGIIDPCLAMLESLAENAMRGGVALAKIVVVAIFLYALYQVLIKSDNE